MDNDIFNYIDKIYEIISEYNYDYKKTSQSLISLKSDILNHNFEKNAYYYQLMATLEYFIYLSNSEESPYKSLLPSNSKIHNYFQKSLELDINNPPLRYLFSLYLYNTGDFINSKQQLLEIDTQYYKDIEMYDRVIKIKELILCCEIFLNEAKESNIIDFFGILKSSEDYTYPGDLIKTIYYNQKYYTSQIKSEINTFE